jgi:hypothetical protein
MEGERNKILKEVEEKWRLRSRAIWLASGDNNTKFFHKYATFNRTRKHIWEISDSDGIKRTEQGELKDATTQYFKNLYKDPPSSNLAEQVLVNNLFTQFVNEEESLSLYSPVTLKELKDVIFHCKKEKSPGPDGWTVEFFTFFFDLIGEDLLEMVEESRRLGKIVGGLNATFLTLIPKANKPIPLRIIARSHYVISVTR